MAGPEGVEPSSSVLETDALKPVSYGPAPMIPDSYLTRTLLGPALTIAPAWHEGVLGVPADGAAAHPPCACRRGAVAQWVGVHRIAAARAAPILWNHSTIPKSDPAQDRMNARMPTALKNRTPSTPKYARVTSASRNLPGTHRSSGNLYRPITRPPSRARGSRGTRTASGRLTLPCRRPTCSPRRTSRRRCGRCRPWRTSPRS